MGTAARRSYNINADNVLSQLSEALQDIQHPVLTLFCFAWYVYLVNDQNSSLIHRILLPVLSVIHTGRFLVLYRFV